MTDFKEKVVDFANILIDERQGLMFKMVGNSMLPTLRNGDIGIVEKCALEKIRIGDILVFKKKNKLIAHRLLKITFDNNGVPLLHTKGDNNTYKDTPISYASVLGKLTVRKRNEKEKIISRPKGLTLYLIMLSMLKASHQLIHFFHLFRTQSRSLIKNIRFILQGSKKPFIHTIILSVLDGIMPLILIYCIKILIDEVITKKYTSNLLHLLSDSVILYTVLTFFLIIIISALRKFESEKLNKAMTIHIQKQLHNKHRRLELAHHENPEEQNKIHRAVQEAGFRPQKMLADIQAIVRSCISLVFLAGMVLAIGKTLLILLVVATLPGLIIQIKQALARYTLKDKQSAPEREMYYYNRVLTGYPYAKELQLFHFFNYFRTRYVKLQNRLFDEKLKLSKKDVLFDIITGLIAAICLFFSLYQIVNMKIAGFITAGGVAFYFLAIQKGYAIMNDFFNSVSRILENNTYLNSLMEFLQFTSKKDSVNLNDFPSSLEKGIEIKELIYNYAGSKRAALDHINLFIPAGKTVAIVGVNGSGKSTLIKILCGLYSIDSGSVLFDDIDITTLSSYDLQEHISTIFQDFALYHITAKDNIKLGRINSDDEKQMGDVIEKASLTDVFSGLPKGSDTRLGNQFEGGEELSIGQWQKIAIARALYRNAPIIMFDEPSSALDPLAEHEFFQSIQQLKNDKTVIIISQKLNTIKWVDLIYVMENGRVHEWGTHQQLMKQKGLYSKMYLTQQIEDFT
jgi:ATP-binding cassette, subfamily B, bacterial